MKIELQTSRPVPAQVPLVTLKQTKSVYHPPGFGLFITLILSVDLNDSLNKSLTTSPQKIKEVTASKTSIIILSGRKMPPMEVDIEAGTVIEIRLEIFKLNGN